MIPAIYIPGEKIERHLSRAELTNKLMELSRDNRQIRLIRDELTHVPPSATKLWLIEVLDNRVLANSQRSEQLVNILTSGEFAT